MYAMAATWTPDDVRERLEEAAATLKRLPDPEKRFTGPLKSWWPASVQESVEDVFAARLARLADGMDPERTHVRLSVITDPAAVERMQECFGWLLLIPHASWRKIVWAKCAGVSTRRIRKATGGHRNTIRYRYDKGLEFIAERLNG